MALMPGAGPLPRARHVPIFADLKPGAVGGQAADIVEEKRSAGRMGNAGTWIWSGLVALMGLAGLFVAARGEHGVPYWGGLVFFVFAVLFIFYMIKRGFDHAERHGAH
jgi:hypothetical protein